MTLITKGKLTLIQDSKKAITVKKGDKGWGLVRDGDVIQTYATKTEALKAKNFVVPPKKKSKKKSG
ncbi:MAG: hypothetical protein JKY75_05665 [Erythrobacter sp.]|jgi:hypothetical protein|nr:hypothetical protein [Erythrobacter sp.]